MNWHRLVFLIGVLCFVLATLNVRSGISFLAAALACWYLVANWGMM